MIKIVKIDWFGDPSSTYLDEADVYLSDGTFLLMTFAHPFENGKVGDILSPLILDVSDIINITKLDKKQFLIEKTNDDFYSYRLAGKVMDAEIIKIGEFLFDLEGDLPKEIKKGDYISFLVYRIDL